MDLAQVTDVARTVRRALVREGRRARARLSAPRVRIVYHEGYRVPANHQIDPKRAQKVIDHLLREGWLATARSVLVPRRISVSDLLRVHDMAYLESLDDPATVARVLGQDELDLATAMDVVRAQRWQTAGTVHATRLALSGGLPGRRSRRVCNLGGGFHHAHAEHGEGFCLFNDIAVAIAVARAEGFAGRILVIDLDMHPGNGTRSIFANDPSVVTCSIHAADWNQDPEAIGSIDLSLGGGVSDATYLRALRDVLPRALREARPDLVFYVAGADVAADDRLGSFRVSPDAVLARDRMVFEHVGELPTVMLLAGGYGPDAWRYTARTLVWLLAREDAPIPSRIELELAHFRRIAHELGREDVLRDGGGVPADDADDFGITEEDIYGELVRKDPPARLLGYYSLYGLEVAFARYGLFAHLSRRGYASPLLVIDPRHGSGHALTVYADETRREVLIELVVRIDRQFPAEGDADACDGRDEPRSLLSIEWLLLQDPRAQATAATPLLPGQDHPGLGALHVVVGMLVIACERLGLDGISFRPAHYHVAAASRDLLRFFDPADEALFLGIRAVLGSLALEHASRMAEDGSIVDAATGAVVRWQPARMVLPVSARLRAVMGAESRSVCVEARAAELHLRIRADADPRENPRGKQRDSASRD